MQRFFIVASSKCSSTTFFHVWPSLSVLGLGDACYNTQIYSIIGSVFKDDSAAGFAIFKFAQSALAAAAFFYSNVIELPYQLLILVILCVLGTITFCTVELQVRRNQLPLPLGTETPATMIEDNSCGIIATNDSNSDDQVPVVIKTWIEDFWRNSQFFNIWQF